MRPTRVGNRKLRILALPIDTSVTGGSGSNVSGSSAHVPEPERVPAAPAVLQTPQRPVGGMQTCNSVNEVPPVVSLPPPAPPPPAPAPVGTVTASSRSARRLWRSKLDTVPPGALPSQYREEVCAWLRLHALIAAGDLTRKRAPPPRLMVLQGPCGCGKRTYVAAAAAAYGLPFVIPETPDSMGKVLRYCVATPGTVTSTGCVPLTRILGSVMGRPTIAAAGTAATACTCTRWYRDGIQS